jgi:hypothetical protein
MSSPGSTISQLSTNTPLSIASSWASQSMVLGQFNSLNISVISDQAGVLAILWSGDNGLHYDTVDTYTITAGVAKRISVIAQQQNVMFIYTNGPVAQTYFRLYTYGVVTNTNVFATLTSTGTIGITGTVDVSNLPDSQNISLPVDPLYPIMQYDFMDVAASSYTMSSNPLVSLYNDLYTYSTGSTATIGNPASQSVLLLRSNDATDRSFVVGKPISYRAGVPIDIRFTSAWTTTAASIGTTRVQGVGRIVPTGPYNIIDYMGFGYVNHGSADNYDGFGIYLVRKSSASFIPRTSWNVDKADGAGTLPVLTIANLNGYRIVRSPEGGDHINFYILNPSSGEYVLVHSIQAGGVGGSSPNWSTSWSLLLMMNLAGTTSVDNPAMSIRSMSMFSVGLRSWPSQTTYCVQYSGSGILAEQLIAAYQLYSLSATPGNRCSIYSITVNHTGAGGHNDPLILNVYNRGSVSGGSYSNINTNLVDIRQNTTASFVSGQLVNSLMVPHNSSATLTLSEDSLTIMDWYNAVLTLKCNSSSSYNMSVIISVN